MPEGHVIHRLAHTFNRDFRGMDLQVSSPQGRFAAEAEQLDGHRLERAEAWGKHLFLLFDAPSPSHIVYIHLGLIGQFLFEDPDTLRGQIRLHISNGEQAANLRGPQWCRLITEEEYEAQLAKVGWDPLIAGTDPAPLQAKVQRSKRAIGSLLLDQGLFAGVGSIYRTEVLFRQQIVPFRPGNELSDAEFSALWQDLVALMQDGVDVGRIDTVAPEHTPEAMGRDPRKDDHGGEVYVYRREGLPCYVCGTPVVSRIMEGRKVFWCATCQR
ncbi:Fpg/Nei family DNA glycosylase [Corynebacterium stationis]|jgi:formamidopyrimidine-DNA glycosylase|uniref:DNA-(apurinic or apyrimidinic site) lyase n=1 Tax=Corynebacterium stationis TaxID=1705 RepID=A0A177I800_9CORY|nr:DNA-formamidopyrimidine glycosylase family protein [Corynebacterium stationis]NME90045.1 Fpg/Nei family DNA glycosylase [Corynebacterium stationis]OAH24874.1 DNA glycosylase [Corynebacterium stationis]WLP87927.1 DNA-formamidopyrimidine glycosylase family protein [Corynebacterium stationis]HHT59299.1 Fpg/Nei family DNA glycosylase [Corynebacterium stationis]